MHFIPKVLVSSHVKRALGGLLVVAACAMAATPVQAQRVPGALGIGGQVGDPSGVTLKVYNPNRLSYDFLAAWDLDDFFFLNLHGLYERPLELENTSGLEYFFGPGGYVGVKDRPAGRDDDVVFGISGRLGINIPLENRFEFYAQITPRINLVPDTDGDLGGGLGVRYYF